MGPAGAGREHLAQVLASTTVPWLAYAVHTRDAPMVRDLLVGLDRQELFGLAVVLASRCAKPLMRSDDGVIDEVAVARACAGEPVPLSAPERGAAAHELAARGVSYASIGKLLHVSDVTARRLLEQDQPAEVLALLSGTRSKGGVSVSVTRTTREMP